MYNTLMKNENEDETSANLDIQKICQKHNVGRHDLCLIATQVARLGGFRPAEALQKLYDCDDLQEYMVSLNFSQEINMDNHN
jgi:hypothetical protein|tara:strand:+ start:84 stop:329 length:246 start_codon:yes stop_codon:yes gene_type:complete